MSQRLASPGSSDGVEAEQLQNGLLNIAYNAEYSRRGAVKAAFALAAAAVLFGTRPVTARAASASKKTLDALSDAEEQLKDVQSQLDQIGDQFQALSEKQDKTIGEIEGVQAKIDDTQKDIEEKQVELEEKQEILARRVTATYKDGPTNTLALVLSATTFEQLVSNAFYADKINASDQRAIDEVHAIQNELGRKKTELEQKKSELEQLKAQQDEQLKEMQAKQTEVSKLVDGLSKDVKDLMSKRDSEYLASVQEEERQRELANQAKTQSGGTTSIPGSGQQSAGTGSQQAVVNACRSTPSPGAGLCAWWVSDVFINAGVGSFSGNACDMYSAWCTSSSKANLKVGMIVATPSHPHSSAGRIYGHVGVYVGGGTLMDNIGYIRSINIDSWISYYGATVTPRWGWLGGVALA